MKKYVIVTFLLISCSRERVPKTYTFDASKDTLFIVEDDDAHHVFLKYDIEGQLEDSVRIEVSYFNSKGTGNENVKLDIHLKAGKIMIKDSFWDFYDSKALFTFKHLNNKKGKLTIKASL
jgi:hypothetical protein